LPGVQDALGDAGTIEQVGWVPKARFDELLERSDLFVSASVGEGCSNSLNHALASGIDILSTPVGAVGDYLAMGVTGLESFPVADADRLAELIGARLDRGGQGRRHDRTATMGQVFDPEREKAQWEDVIRSLVPKPAAARANRQFRIMLFTHDGSGLGHLRRLARISEALQGPCSCLFVSGHGEMSWMVPPGSEFVRIPSYDRIIRSKSRYWGREPFWQEDERTSLAFRNEVLNATFRAYEPDAVIVDYLPLGKNDELSHIISDGKCRKYLIWRGILDDPANLRSDVLKGGAERALRNAYDRIFVCCDSKVIDLEKEYQFGPEIASKMTYVGYVAPACDPGQRPRVRRENGVPDGTRWVVCSAGGGKFAEDVVGECLRLARKRPDLRFDIIYGPRTALHWPYGLTNRVQEENLVIWRECPCLPDLHMAADAVVCPGGYNSSVECMAGGTPMVVVPVQWADNDEQHIQANRLSRHHNIRIATSISMIESNVMALLSDSKPMGAVHSLAMQGAETLGREIILDLSSNLRADELTASKGSDARQGSAGMPLP
jgi:predicted glycosyltransferase